MSLLIIGSGSTVADSESGVWAETRFHTGCVPGPAPPPPWPDPLVTHTPSPDAPEQVTLRVDLGDDDTAETRPILGTGFNFEHALWSCPEFRGLFRSEILDPFQPALARVDSGLLPVAPAELPAAALGPAVYESVLSSAPYADSWRFFQRLNRAGVRIILGVWGGPAQFTDDGTRRGVLLPKRYDDYVEYVATVVDILVRTQHIQVWVTTIANEPVGGDGNQIPPDGLAYIAHQLAPCLAADDVKLYGPDTADGRDALQYLPLFLNDPTVADSLAFVGFHQYFPSDEVGDVVSFVHSPSIARAIAAFTTLERSRTYVDAAWPGRSRLTCCTRRGRAAATRRACNQPQWLSVSTRAWAFATSADSLSTCPRATHTDWNRWQAGRAEGCMRVVGIAGSASRNSANSAAARHGGCDRLARSSGLGGSRPQLPSFRPHTDGDQELTRLRQAVAVADAVWIATPEYAGGMPGALKNAFDCLVGSGEMYSKRIVVPSAAPSEQRGGNARRWVEEVARMQGALVMDSFTVALPPGKPNSGGLRLPV